MHLKNTILLSAVLLFVYSTGCANDETSVANNTSTSSDTTSLPPVETKSPNSNYKPAFAGQTRISGAKTTTPYKVEKIAEKMGITNKLEIKHH